jgi:hypothetical protein
MLGGIALAFVRPAAPSRLAVFLGGWEMRRGGPGRDRAADDVRAFGPDERIVFLPYTASAYEQSQRWMRARGLFEPSHSPHDFASAVVA